MGEMAFCSLLKSEHSDGELEEGIVEMEDPAEFTLQPLHTLERREEFKKSCIRRLVR